MQESLSELETELCRLPGVIVTRFVGGSGGRPLGATVFVAAGSAPDRIRSSIQMISSVHFDIEIDPSRMVVIEVGETSLDLPDRPVRSAPAPDQVVSGTGDTEPGASALGVAEESAVTEQTSSIDAAGNASPDSEQALASAQNAVHSLLRTLTTPPPGQDDPETSSPSKASADADTIVVGNSDTADTRPANN